MIREITDGLCKVPPVIKRCNAFNCWGGLAGPKAKEPLGGRIARKPISSYDMPVGHGTAAAQANHSNVIPISRLDIGCVSGAMTLQTQDKSCAILGMPLTLGTTDVCMSTGTTYARGPKVDTDHHLLVVRHSPELQAVCFLGCSHVRARAGASHEATILGLHE